MFLKCIYEIVKYLNKLLYIKILITHGNIITDWTELFLTSTSFIPHSPFYLIRKVIQDKQLTLYSDCIFLKKGLRVLKGFIISPLDFFRYVC